MLADGTASSVVALRQRDRLLFCPPVDTDVAVSFSTWQVQLTNLEKKNLKRTSFNNTYRQSKIPYLVRVARSITGSGADSRTTLLPILVRPFRRVVVDSDNALQREALATIIG